MKPLFSERHSTPFDEDYTSFIESLSFSKTHLDDTEPSELKNAWTRFLRNAFDSDMAWGWPCNVGMAEWYCDKEMPLHAIAVYEHLLAEIQEKGLIDSRGEYCDEFQEWLLRLFQLCRHQERAERALVVGGLIGDFHDRGFFGPAEYFEVVATIPTLRRSRMGETAGDERAEAIRRCREVLGHLFEKLHEITRRFVIEAELWSIDVMRGIDPSDAPRYCSLAIESEFHFKVFKPNHRVLRCAFDPPREEGKSCGIGEILT